ncbi:hypothetical protein [Pseudomonas shahriarae]|uniref:DUF2489 domain-containing protein n=1 Tax=Pseudomonas shahriarae TaxID=2745512 RepID=A0ABT5NB67_9PSED|nr:hypothetical protein [Pseudomonas shahriarae]MDD0985790.1 hypothetical protein [Pseudomonas shahriarae]MDD1032728.1 hypothetical protein [Pseudomonas shahriarae]
MEAISPSVWFPVVTLVIGVFLKALFDAWSENRKAGFEKQARVEKRKEIIFLQRIDLQRKALGDIQIALSDLMRCTTVMYLAESKMYHESGEWGAGELASDVCDQSRSAFRQVTLAKVRVRDEHVRDMAERISKLCSQVSFSESRDDSEDALIAAGRIYDEFNEKVGESLRALEDEEQALLI